MAPSFDRTGFWGPRTANIDWCEENYEVSLSLSLIVINIAVIKLIRFYFHQTGKTKQSLGLASPALNCQY